MRTRPTAGLLLLAACAAVATAQDRTRTYSTPEPPPRETLDRLGLKMAWQTSVGMDGRRDGFLGLYAAGSQLVAQTRSGLVCVIDAADGHLVWQTRLGSAYAGVVPPGFNSYVVVVVNNGVAYGLDRASGRIIWDYTLPYGLAVAPVCDEDNVYFCNTNQRVFAFRLPRGELDVQPLLAEEKLVTGPRPGSTRPGDEAAASRAALLPLWDAAMPFAIDTPPVSANGQVVLLVGGNGTVSGLSRRPVADFATAESFRWSADGPITVTPGAYQDMAYVGSQDTNVYATSLGEAGDVTGEAAEKARAAGRVVWRYTAGSPIIRRPIALESDLYVVSERGGLTRLNRENGAPLWKVPRGRDTAESNPDLERFLAANEKFVYALDRQGRLCVVDRRRGSVLGSVDARDFPYPVPNENTDRVFLAANNGLIVCLHDRDYPVAVKSRKVPEPSYNVRSLTVDANVQVALSKRLAANVTLPESKPMPLRQAILKLAKDFDLGKPYYARRAYADQAKLALLDKDVVIPKVEGKPLGSVLDAVLAQADSQFIALDIVLLLPGKAKLPPAPPKP